MKAKTIHIHLFEEFKVALKMPLEKQISDLTQGIHQLQITVQQKETEIKRWKDLCKSMEEEKNAKNKTPD